MSLYPMVILAGGLATRIRPVTETRPKSLILIHGEPFIYHQLRLLKKQGITEVVLCIGYLGEMIQEAVGSGKQWGMHVHYVNDGARLLGTAGAIKRSLPILGDYFFVLYGDSYLPCDLRAMQHAFKQSDKDALMTVFHNHGLWDKSNVDYADGRIIAYDKNNTTKEMNYIDYGLGVFKKSAFSSLHDNQIYDLAFVYQSLLDHQQLAAFEVSERFYEVGSFDGIKTFTEYLDKESINVY